MKILITILLKIVLILAIMIMSTTIVWFLPGDYNHDLAALINKRDLIISKQSPRIIFIGGSNLATLNSQKIEQAVNRTHKPHYSVANMGLWAGLSIQRYLEEIKSLLNQDDIVIVCQEYAPLLDSAFYSFIQSNEEAKKIFFLMQPKKQIEQYLEKRDYFEIVKIVILLNQLKIKTYLHTLIDCNMRHISTNGFYHYGRD